MFWVISAVLVIVGPVVLRYAELISDAFFARSSPNHSATDQPTFGTERPGLFAFSRDTRIALTRFFGVGSIIVGLGFALVLLVS